MHANRSVCGTANNKAMGYHSVAHTVCTTACISPVYVRMYPDHYTLPHLHTVHTMALECLVNHPTYYIFLLRHWKVVSHCTVCLILRTCSLEHKVRINAVCAYICMTDPILWLEEPLWRKNGGRGGGRAFTSALGSRVASH